MLTVRKSVSTAVHHTIKKGLLISKNAYLNRLGASPLDFPFYRLKGKNGGALRPKVLGYLHPTLTS